jgi:heparinase II/III-like protein
MKLERLKTMSVSEVAYRGRQEAYKLLERVRANGNGPMSASRVFKLSQAPTTLSNRVPSGIDTDFSLAAKILWNRFEQSGATRFFEGASNSESATILNEELSDAASRIVATADQILEGRFDLLGYEDLSFGAPIDWRLDPVSGRRSPLVHWSRVNPLDPSAVGDSKVVWELNRHQWLMHLGQAYRLTGDETYARAFATYVRQWIRGNPPGMGINWASSLEVALRILSWSWALFLFRGSNALSPDLFVRMLEGISYHAAHVEKYLSYYFAPNTHLTGEALGLFYAGTLFPELPQACRWRELGARILIEESERQILPDGVYFEQSTCYQRYTAEIYLHFLILAERNQLTLPRTLIDRVQRLLDVLLALNRPNGSLPDIGDADAGWLLPFDVRASDDGRGVFALAAALFNRTDYAWAARGSAPETIWLLGPGGHKKYRRLEPAAPRSARMQAYPNGGYVVMRSGWTRDAHQLIFDVGPLSSPKSGHGHADLLAIQCSVFGEPYIVDPGTCCYTPEPEWRNFFRGSSAHSTITVDGEGQAISTGPFHWKERPQARLRRWLTTTEYGFADAEHDAYRRLTDPVLHRRRVIFVKSRYWIIIDDLLGAAAHQVDLRLQFADLQANTEPADWTRVNGKTGGALLIRTFASAPLQTRLVAGSVEPIQGWISPVYGCRRPAPVLIRSAFVKLPFRAVTLLLPSHDASAPCPDVLPILSERTMPFGLILPRQEKIIFHENSAVISKD